jgi:hypothetical protein
MDRSPFGSAVDYIVDQITTVFYASKLIFVMGSGTVKLLVGGVRARFCKSKRQRAFVNHRAFEAQIAVNVGRIVFDVVVELLATMSYE